MTESALTQASPKDTLQQAHAAMTESALTQDPPEDPLQQAHSAMTESALTQYARFYNRVSTDSRSP